MTVFECLYQKDRKIVKLSIHGLSQIRVSKIPACNHKTVGWWMQKWWQNASLADDRRSGKEKSLTDFKTEGALLRRKDPAFASVRGVASATRADHVQVSKSTVHRMAGRVGMKDMPARKLAGMVER